MIHSCPLCQYFSTFYSARTIYLHWKPSRDCLVQPCHSGLHLQSRKVCFSWDQLCVSLIFPRSILSACWMGVHVQCWVSCAFFLSGVWVSCSWHSVCRPPVGHRPWVEEHCSTTLTEASPKHKDFHQFCTRKLFSPSQYLVCIFPIFTSHWSCHYCWTSSRIIPPLAPTPWFEHSFTSLLLVSCVTHPVNWPSSVIFSTFIRMLLLHGNGVMLWQSSPRSRTYQSWLPQCCAEEGDYCLSPRDLLVQLPWCLQRSPCICNEHDPSCDLQSEVMEV